MQNGTVDIERSSTTNNAARKQQVAFAVTTYVTETRFSVKAASGITSVEQLFVSGVRAEESPVKPDSSLEIIQYKAPEGWKAADQAGKTARIFTSPESNGTQQAIILMVLSPPLGNVEFRAAFDAAVKELAGSGRLVESSEAASVKTRQGFEALSQTLVTEGSPGLHARMVAAKVDGRMAGFYYLTTSEALYDQRQPDMDALLKSVNFNVGAGAPVAAKVELEKLAKEKQELLKRVAEIESRERQLAGGAPTGAPSGGQDGAAAIADGAKRLADAKERFAREVGRRRKAHTISGDILGLDGKPIPNVAEYRVQVWGTTIAAEKTRYGLDVDDKGHFEQQIPPDGIIPPEWHVAGTALADSSCCGVAQRPTPWRCHIREG